MKRLTLFLGHYGSGKTNLAVNWAMKAAEEGKKVEIADLDIVNPYFRTKDSQKELEAAGVKVIALPFANSSVDLPAIPSEAYGLVEDGPDSESWILEGTKEGPMPWDVFLHISGKRTTTTCSMW